MSAAFTRQRAFRADESCPTGSTASDGDATAGVAEVLEVALAVLVRHELLVLLSRTRRDARALGHE
jgi:hypothetical protein